MTKRPLELHLHTNNDCNLHCRHCYNRSGEAVSCQSPPVEAILQTLRYFDDTYETEVHLEGGEIFLRPELLSRMGTLPETLLAKITITTNGTIRQDDPAILTMLKKLHLLRISVEGHTEEQQMLIRGISLEPVLENAAFYQASGIPVCLRLTLHRLNYSGFASQTIPSLAARGFSRFQVYEFQSVGRGTDVQSELTLNFPLYELWTELSEHGLPDGTRFDLMLPARRAAEIQQAALELEKQNFVCNALLPENSLSIHADGEVFLCAWDNHPEHQLFNWYQQASSRALLQSIPLTHTCTHCSAFRVSLAG